MSKVLVSSARTFTHLLLPEAKTDDVFFRLHYVWTTRVLVAFALFVLTVTSLKDSIVCYSNARAIPTAIVNLYCWLLDTNLLPSGLRGELGTDVIQPGVYKHTPGDARVYQRYYMWVPLMLLFQAATFYLGRLLWKGWEDGQVGHLVIGLDRCFPVSRTNGVERPIVEADRDKPESKTELHRRYHFIGYQLADQWNSHTGLFVRYLICQVINLINAVVQIFVLDYFFGGQFTTYGFAVLNFVSMDPAERADPAILLFPRMTKCSYRQYGFSGNVENLDILCAMPYNVYYEKMFIFCYFWYLIVAILSALNVVRWFLVTAYEPVRKYMLDLNDAASDHNIRGQNPLEHPTSSNWFFMHLILGNIDGLHHPHILAAFLEKSNR